MCVYVCEHTVYKHLLKGKEFWLIFIQLKQGLYTFILGLEKRKYANKGGKKDKC